jgi:integrase
MVKVSLPGIATATAKGRTYHYAWRGGPRLQGKPGTAEFVASYTEAHANRRAPDDGRVRALVTRFKASDTYKGFADSTRKQWAPWLDRISDHFGDLRVSQFDRADKIRPAITRWRDKWRETPRTADYGMQVLSRVMAFAVEHCQISANPCEKIKGIYTADRAAIIWTDEDRALLKATCSPEIARAVDLAAHTGLRLGDLLKLSWAHVGDQRILIATGKSGRRRDAVIPLYGDLKGLLATIPKRSTAILTNSKGRPWTTDGFGSSFNKAKIAAGMQTRDLHFHDLRGTAATKFYLAGIDERAIAEIMAWEEGQVTRIIRRYVARTAATDALILKLDQLERRT